MIPTKKFSARFHRLPERLDDNEECGQSRGARPSRKRWVRAWRPQRAQCMRDL